MDKINKAKDSVSRKIQETAKETEKLKKELEALIASGIQGTQGTISLLPSVPVPHTELSSLTNRVQVTRSRTVTKTNIEAAPEKSEKKSKSYNVYDTKEVMKKQKTETEIRKEKLNELHKKATEILKKNLEAKKQTRPKSIRAQVSKIRSKSSDPSKEHKKKNSIISFNSAKSLTRTPVASNENLDQVVSPQVAPQMQHSDFLQVPQFEYATSTKAAISSTKIATPVEAATSTKAAVDIPHWLKEQPQGDPYNFINTVKRQLECTNTQKNLFLVDVGVQGSPEELSSAKSDLKSFLSHNCLNLDPRAVQHIELNSNKRLNNAQDGFTILLSDHGSDTSKNIPSICSESRTPLKQISENSKSSSSNQIKLSKVKSNLFTSGEEEKGSGDVRTSTEETKKNQGTIPKKQSSKLSVSQKQQSLRNITLRNTHSDSEGYTSDFLSPDFSGRQNSIFSVQTERTKSVTSLLQNLTVSKGGCSDANNRVEKSSSSASQLVETSSKSRNSVKQSMEFLTESSCSNTKRHSKLHSPINHRKSEKTKLTMNITTRPSSNASRPNLMENVTLRPSDISNLNDRPNVLHLKFDLEIKLLSDFNETIQRLSEIEKTYETLRTDKEPATCHHYVDTQTSLKEESRELVDKTLQESQKTSKTFDLTNSSIWLNLTQPSDSTSMSQLQLEETSSEKDNSMYKGIAGVSLKMFERMIKEEDERIEHWKKLLKFREQSLLDRTRGELVYLEMQRKQLIETGKLAEASSIKKKQRGILLKHQQERMEMQRLKQMQKEDSLNRKTLLKKERNEIKKQLLCHRASSKVRRTTNREKSTLGPLKVLDSSAICSENLISEVTDQEAMSLTRSCLGVATGDNDTDLQHLERFFAKEISVSSVAVDDVKKTLLMRERALAKRRKTVEELLQWHKKLLDEEKVIKQLETKIKTIAVQAPAPTQEDENTKHTETPSDSQSTLEHIPQHGEQQSDDSRVVTSTNYSLDFDFESGQPDTEEQSSVSSISRLIENVNKVQDNILNSSVTFKSSAENPIEEDNIPEQVEEPEQSKTEELSVIIDESEKAASSADDLPSVIIVEEIANDSVSVQDTQSPVSHRFGDSIIVINSDDSKNSEEFEEAANYPHSPRPEENQNISLEDVVEEVDPISREDQSTSNQYDEIEDYAVSNSSPSQQSFENKTDEEKAASLSGKSVLAIKGRFSVASSAVEILDEEDGSVSSEDAREDEESSVADESRSGTEPLCSILSPPSTGVVRNAKELGSNVQSLQPELLSEEKKSSILTEAEELHRKQLAIEQEIKLLKEQQQKEAATPFYLREIPDKPPPPYTPPSKCKTTTTPAVIPKTKEECEQIIEYCVKIIHKAYMCDNLENITISENTLSLIAKDIDKSSYKFVFDLCKEVATDHNGQFAKIAGPSWLKVEQKPTLAISKPLNIAGLKKLMQERVLSLLGFNKGKPKVESSIIKWSRKNRDQVDEALVQEMQREDAAWTNLEIDSVLVKDRMVTELMKAITEDTARAFKKAMAKKLGRIPLNAD